MALEQAIILWIHLLCATIWVGGSIFLGVVLSPMLKTITNSMEERIRLMITIGKRFNKIAVPSLAILIATGIYNSKNFISNPDLLTSTSYGQFLVIKIILVFLLVITYIVHVQLFNKNVERKVFAKELSESQIQKLRKRIIILGEVTVVLSVAILFFAALLNSGF